MDGHTRSNQSARKATPVRKRSSSSLRSSTSSSGRSIRWDPGLRVFNPKDHPVDTILRKSSIGTARTASTVTASTGYSGISRAPSYFSSASSAPPPRLAAKHVLHVFHSAPLVYQDCNHHQPQPVPVLDLVMERKGLKIALEDTGVDVMFDTCTTDRLGKFLSQGRGKVLHYSGHGHAEEVNGEWGKHYLAIEDGWGKMHKLTVQDLAEWIEQGGGNLQLVFVSACHSRAAGDAFCKAGVKHVVCCKRDDLKIRNDAATEFTKGFYQALAHGRTISQAFDEGRSKVKTSHRMDRAVAHGEVEKFVLLPEDARHDVKIFGPNDDSEDEEPRAYTSEELQLLSGPKSGTLPRPPDDFQGREVDMYNVLSELQRTRIVRITGPEGIGKRSVVAGVCQYIQDRKHVFKDEIDFLAWLDIDSETGQIDFSPLLEEFSVGTNQSFRERLQEKLNETKTLLIVDARNVHNDNQHRCVEELLHDVVHYTDARVVMVERFDHPGETKLVGGLPETEVHIEPLGFLPTVWFFGKRCKHVYSGVNAVKCLRDFRSFVVDDDSKPLDTKIGRKFYHLMGGGYPQIIQEKAKSTSLEAYKKLLQLGTTLKKIQKWKQELQLQTRNELDKLHAQLLTKKEEARASEEYAQAGMWKIKLEELDLMQEKLPDLPSLIAEVQEVEAALHRADDEEDYANAGQLKIKLVELTLKLQTERMATRNPRKLKRHTSQIGARARVDELNEAYAEAIEEDDYDRAESIQRALKREEKLLASKPTIEKLREITVQRLEEYTAAKSNALTNRIDCNLEELRELHQAFVVAYDREAAEDEAQLHTEANTEAEDEQESQTALQHDGGNTRPPPTEASVPNLPISTPTNGQLSIPKTFSLPMSPTSTAKKQSDFGSRGQLFTSGTARKPGFKSGFGSVSGFGSSPRMSSTSLPKKKPAGEPMGGVFKPGAESPGGLKVTKNDIQFQPASQDVSDSPAAAESQRNRKNQETTNIKEQLSDEHEFSSESSIGFEDGDVEGNYATSTNDNGERAPSLPTAVHRRRQMEAGELLIHRSSDDRHEPISPTKSSSLPLMRRRPALESASDKLSDFPEPPPIVSSSASTAIQRIRPTLANLPADFPNRSYRLNRNPNKERELQLVENVDGVPDRSNLERKLSASQSKPSARRPTTIDQDARGTEPLSTPFRRKDPPNREGCHFQSNPAEAPPAVFGTATMTAWEIEGTHTENPPIVREEDSEGDDDLNKKMAAVSDTTTLMHVRVPQPNQMLHQLEKFATQETSEKKVAPAFDSILLSQPSEPMLELDETNGDAEAKDKDGKQLVSPNTASTMVCPGAVSIPGTSNSVDNADCILGDDTLSAGGVYVPVAAMLASEAQQAELNNLMVEQGFVLAEEVIAEVVPENSIPQKKGALKEAVRKMVRMFRRNKKKK